MSRQRAMVFALWIALALGALAPAAASMQKPHPVTVGMYVTRVPEVSLHDNRFVVDFWIWFRWDGDEIDRVETFEVVGGQIESKDSVSRAVVTEDGRERNYAACRVVATISQYWEVGRFPFLASGKALGDLIDSQNVLVQGQRNHGGPGHQLDTGFVQLAARIQDQISAGDIKCASDLARRQENKLFRRFCRAGWP